MTKFIFSQHSLYKFSFFKKHQIIIRPKQLKDAIFKGKTTDIRELPKIEVTGKFDDKHSLVVIYRKVEEDYFIITFWIAEKGRYESKIQ